MPTITIVRNYNIILTRYKNSIYQEDPTWIAEWFFNNYIADNVTFEIRGSKHVTFPNPEHVSVKVIYEDGSTTDWLHMSQNADGTGYNQELVIGMGNRSNKNIKKLKKLKKLRKLKTLKNIKIH